MRNQNERVKLSCGFHAAVWESEALEKPENEPIELIGESLSTEVEPPIDPNP
jgi:hypothetical protein